MTVVARMVASLEAETSQFHARMTAAETQITKWSGSTASGTRATRILNNSLQQLTFQAAGIPGPIGKAASAIGVLGIGGGPVMLAVAALGALAIVWKEVDAAATLAADNVVAAANRMERNITAAAGSASSIALFQRSIAEAEARLDSLRTSPLGPQRFQMAPPGSGLPPLPVGTPAEDRAAQIAKTEEVIRRLNVGLGAIDRRLAEQEARQRSLARVLPAVPMVGIGEQLFQRDQAKMREDVFIKIAKDEIAKFRVHIPSEGVPAAEGFQFTPEFGVMSAMALMQGVHSGSVGGFLGAAAGPVAMVNPLAGAITAGVGGIFSLFDQSENRRHQELIDKLERMAKAVGLERVTVVFTGPDGHQVRKSLAELEESDAVERVPGPVGVGG